jgi:serine/threonine protein kinase
MESRKPTKLCPQCGNPLDSATPDGLCAKCRPADSLPTVGMTMGTVYRAEQTAPIRRVVALKVVKIGMDSSHVLSRFAYERQALAMMDHPHIARVFDANVTEKGRPFFVMEYVDGIPITKYCDDRRLNTGERLKLFLPICEAVQHAHQKGIIHRDLKPTNVLVEEIDGRPIAKVIDFGIAKAVDQGGADDPMLTQLGQFVGTPEYMSPEQADPLNQTVDATSDVYSLGVMLYELLVGAVPFDSSTMRKAGLAEVLRVRRPRCKPNSPASATPPPKSRKCAAPVSSRCARNWPAISTGSP